MHTHRPNYNFRVLRGFAVILMTVTLCLVLCACGMDSFAQFVETGEYAGGDKFILKNADNGKYSYGTGDKVFRAKYPKDIRYVISRSKKNNTMEIYDLCDKAIVYSGDSEKVYQFLETKWSGVLYDYEVRRTVSDPNFVPGDGFVMLKDGLYTTSDIPYDYRPDDSSDIEAVITVEENDSGHTVSILDPVSGICMLSRDYEDLYSSSRYINDDYLKRCIYEYRDMMEVSNRYAFLINPEYAPNEWADGVIGFNPQNGIIYPLNYYDLYFVQNDYDPYKIGFFAAAVDNGYEIIDLITRETIDTVDAESAYKIPEKCEAYRLNTNMAPLREDDFMPSDDAYCTLCYYPAEDRYGYCGNSLHPVTAQDVRYIVEGDNEYKTVIDLAKRNDISKSIDLDMDNEQLSTVLAAVARIGRKDHEDGSMLIAKLDGKGYSAENSYLPEDYALTSPDQADDIGGVVVLNIYNTNKTSRYQEVGSVTFTYQTVNVSIKSAKSGSVLAKKTFSTVQSTPGYVESIWGNVVSETTFDVDKSEVSDWIFEKWSEILEKRS